MQYMYHICSLYICMYIYICDFAFADSQCYAAKVQGGISTNNNEETLKSKLISQANVYQITVHSRYNVVNYDTVLHIENSWEHCNMPPI